MIASGGFTPDNTVRLWSTSTYTQLASMSGHSGTVYTLTYMPSSNLLASGSFDQSIITW